MTGVVFDFGNVLYRFDYRAMARKLVGNRAGDLLGVFQGGRIQHAYETGRWDLARVLAALGEAGFPLTRSRFLDAYLSIFEPVPGMADLLDRVAGNHPVALLSNTSPEHARLFIEQTPEAKWFGTRIYSFDAGVMKPDPTIYLRAVEALGIPGRELAYVDDVPAYAQAAESAEMVPVPFLDAPTLAHSLARLGFPELDERWHPRP